MKFRVLLASLAAVAVCSSAEAQMTAPGMQQPYVLGQSEGMRAVVVDVRHEESNSTGAIVGGVAGALTARMLGGRALGTIAGAGLGAYAGHAIASHHERVRLLVRPVDGGHTFEVDAEGRFKQGEVLLVGSDGRVQRF